MTTYNTGNPIGSTEVKDLYDNAQNFDTLSTTTTLEAVPDRLGVPRMSLHGFEQEAKRRFESIKFQPPIPYAPGIEVTTSSLTVDYLGVLYYALPSALPFTTGAWNPAQWSPLQNTNPGNELLVFDDYASASAAAATLPDGQSVQVQDGSGLFAVASGALVEDQEFDFQKNYAASTIGANLKAWVNVKSFPWLAKGDGVADDTAAIRAAISTGLNVFMPRGVYKITGGIHQQRGQLVHGAGCDQWDFASTTGKPQYMERGTTILASGVCDDYVQVFGVTENRLTGGVTPNTTGDSSEFTEYVLSDFTNKNATGTAPATLKQVKCAWVLEEASNASLANIRIQLNYNGIDGYNDPLLTGLGDDYDIGLMVLNSSFCDFHNVQSVGYWRMGALAHINSEDKSVGLSKMGEGTFNTFSKCFFQGLRGAILRGADDFPVVSVDPGVSFTVPYTASNLIAVGDSLVNGGTSYTATALSVESDLLRISVAGATPSVGALLRHVTYNFGVAGTVFRDCVISGLFHKSRLSPKELGLDKGSIAIEASGGILRDFDFINCHAFDGECLLYANSVDDLNFVASYLEPYGTKYPGGTWRASGAKVIAQGYDAASWATYPVKGTRNLTFDRSSEINANVDMYPWNVLRPSRYTDAGYFRPLSTSIEANGSQTLNAFPKQGWGVPTTIIATDGAGLARSIRFLRPDFTYLGRVIDTTGYWGIGPKDPQSRLHVSTDSSAAISATHDLVLDAPNAGMQFRSTAASARWTRLWNNGTSVILQASAGQSSSYTTTCFSYNYVSPEFAVEGVIRHVQDNVHSYGTAVRRGTTIYLGSAPVVTSDERDKQQIRPLQDSERAVGVRLKALIKAFKYNEAFERKGDGARIHVGWIAQEVKSAFEAEGLNGFDYACLCYDEWDATEEHPAGSRYGIREGQILAFILASQ